MNSTRTKWNQLFDLLNEKNSTKISKLENFNSLTYNKDDLEIYREAIDAYAIYGYLSLV
jgi:23S rRNA maturation mini-RNase III